MDKPHLLISALADAVHTCWDLVTNDEEHGGVIMHQPKTGAYGFIPLTNQNKDTPLGPVLWTADRFEYAQMIIPMFREGWQHYGSFHTHPLFYPWPSSEDLNVLFPGFPNNYIYSGVTKQLIKYYWQELNPDEQIILTKVIDL